LEVGGNITSVRQTKKRPEDMGRRGHELSTVLLGILVLLFFGSTHSLFISNNETLDQEESLTLENVNISSNVPKHRQKRYALEGSRWRVDEVTYKISKYSEQLPKETVDKIIKKAFNTWAKVTNLKFVEKKGGKVHIDIRFEKGAHGDDAPFDGPGGYRAHAFFPGYGGDAHFDDDEKWTLEQTASKDGSRLLLVATHELGHALGLGHSEDKSALMAASHEEWEGKVKLSDDDIKAIQALYGKPGEPRPESGDPALGRGPGPNGPRGPGRRPGGPGRGPGGPPFRPGGAPPFVPSHGFPEEGGPPFIGGPPPPGGPQFGGPPPIHGGPPPVYPGQEGPLVVINPERRVNSVPRDEPRRLPQKPDRRIKDDKTFDIDYVNDDSEFFNDVDTVIENNVDEFSDDIDGKRPSVRKVNEELCNGGGVDTMVTLKNDDSYVFKGKKFWKLTETSVAAGYPKIISEEWDGLPGNLDAAFTWKNGKMYFFKGTRYWRFSASKQLDKGFPKDISEGFESIPNDVDAAFVWGKNDKIYFFKGSDYWKFDPKKNPPVDESYPRPISNWDGIPNHLNAAMQYHNGNTYFFKDGKYYRFDEETFSVDTKGPSYPRDTGAWWFGCQDDKPRRLTKKTNNRRFILD